MMAMVLVLMVISIHSLKRAIVSWMWIFEVSLGIKSWVVGILYIFLHLILGVEVWDINQTFSLFNGFMSLLGVVLYIPFAWGILLYLCWL